MKAVRVGHTPVFLGCLALAIIAGGLYKELNPPTLPVEAGRVVLVAFLATLWSALMLVGGRMLGLWICRRPILVGHAWASAIAGLAYGLPYVPIIDHLNPTIHQGGAVPALVWYFIPAMVWGFVLTLLARFFQAPPPTPGPMGPVDPYALMQAELDSKKDHEG